MSPHRAASLVRACSVVYVLAVVACSNDTSSGLFSPAGPALSAASVALPLSGTVVSGHTAVYPPGTNTALIHEVGTGSATHLGRYAWVEDITLDLVTLTGTAQATLTAANGDVVRATVVVSGTPAGGVFVDTEEVATITGGTGRFARAEGSYTLKRSLNVATGASTGSFDGSITYWN
jgi:hypothetical protein